VKARSVAWSRGSPLGKEPSDSQAQHLRRRPRGGRLVARARRVKREWRVAGGQERGVTRGAEQGRRSSGHRVAAERIAEAIACSGRLRRANHSLGTLIQLSEQYIDHRGLKRHGVPLRLSGVRFMTRIIHARIDRQTERMLRRLERSLGWSRSKIIREGIRRLQGSLIHRSTDRIVGLGRFRSGVPDLGSNKDRLRGFGRGIGYIQ
jgi:hypothetical protein